MEGLKMRELLYTNGGAERNLSFYLVMALLIIDMSVMYEKESIGMQLKE